MSRLDLTGQRFGRLTAEEPAPPRVLLSGKHTAWWCLCDCGARTAVTTSALRYGQIRSCGCARRENAGRPRMDLTGQRYGRLVVEGRAPDLSHGQHRTAWHVRCDCGKEAIVTTFALRSGNKRSCGCGRGRRL